MDEEERRAKLHEQHMEAVDELRARIEELEQRQPELRRQIPALRKQIAELQREIVRLERAKPEDDAAADEQFAALHEQREELETQATELAAELESIGPELIQVRCTLGMKMSDFALDDHEGHEDALTYLQPLLNELRSAYGRATWDAERIEDDEEERLAALIAAETIGVNIEQANVRVARHRLALVDPDDKTLHLSRELQLDEAMILLDEARAKVTALQEQKRSASAQPKPLAKKKLFGRR
jgi:chaperonin cofactor prefoldin